jgi:ABC-2 type transport system permease protein
MSFLKGPTRFLAVVGKEIVSVIRRPAALASMVAGPFLMLAIFGLGYVGRPPLNVMLVIPPESGLPGTADSYRKFSNDAPIRIVDTVADPDTARAELAAHTVDLIVIAPSDAEARFKAGQQATLVVEYDTEDPVANQYAQSVAVQIASEVNAMLIEHAVQQGGAAVGAAPGALPIPPQVIARPTRADPRNLAPTVPGVVAFFGPAVLALILQHMAITLSALSMTRERFGGIVEVFRVAPIAASEILAGKAVALIVLVGATGTLLLALMLAFLHVPMLGDPALILITFGALTFASVSLGLGLSALADSERQAVQLALLALLASVFFGGFVLDLSQFGTPVRILGNALPVTQGIQLAQDLFLRGSTDQLWRLALLGTMGMVFFLVAWLRYRRVLRAAT